VPLDDGRVHDRLPYEAIRIPSTTLAKAAFRVVRGQANRPISWPPARSLPDHLISELVQTRKEGWILLESFSCHECSGTLQKVGCCSSPKPHIYVST
jgi:hypothetical protein